MDTSLEWKRRRILGYIWSGSHKVKDLQVNLKKRWPYFVDEILRRRGRSLVQVEENEIYKDKDVCRQIVKFLPTER